MEKLGGFFPTRKHIGRQLPCNHNCMKVIVWEVMGNLSSIKNMPGN